MENQSSSMQQAQRLANSQAGQQLLALLKQKDPQALQQAQSGDYAKALHSLKEILSSPTGQQILKDLGR